jgi:hypothetical protein
LEANESIHAACVTIEYLSLVTCQCGRLIMLCNSKARDTYTCSLILVRAKSFKLLSALSEELRGGQTNIARLGHFTM